MVKSPCETAPERAIGAESTPPKSLCARIERPRFCLLTLIDEPGSAWPEMGAGYQRPFRCQRSSTVQRAGLSSSRTRLTPQVYPRESAIVNQGSAELPFRARLFATHNEIQRARRARSARRISCRRYLCRRNNKRFRSVPNLTVRTTLNWLKAGIRKVSVRLIFRRVGSCCRVHARHETPARSAQFGTSQHHMDTPNHAYGSKGWMFESSRARSKHPRSTASTPRLVMCSAHSYLRPNSNRAGCRVR